MKKSLVFLLFFLFAGLVAIPVFQTDASGTTSRREIRSRVNQKCSLESNDFTVAAGSVATAFSVDALEAGYNCGTGAAIDCKGWGIKQGERTVYRYEKCTTGQKYEEPVSLSNLRLQPGEYTIYVDGGRGAYVVVTFNN